MENEIRIVDKNESLMAMNKAEIDIQISTAKQYPRVLKDVLNKIETLASIDTETAEDCFYALKRGKGEDSKVIEGLSVRFAEIIANSWGNLRVQTRILGNDGKMITAQAVCHDLESNVAVSVEVHRRITDKYGKTYSDDMLVVTGNAASAIAYRNAVLKVVPKAITKRIVENVKAIAQGQAMDMSKQIANCFSNFKKAGAEEAQILEFLEIKSISEITKEHIFTLKGLWNAIKEGSTSIKETFAKKGIEKSDLDILTEKIILELSTSKLPDVDELKKKCSKLNKDKLWTMEVASEIAFQLGIDTANL